MSPRLPPLAFAFALLLFGCADRPEGNLIAVRETAPGASKVDMLVATTRAPVAEPPGVMFGGDRAIGLRFADIVVSIPPDAARKVGEVQWPSALPGDPAKDFVTLSAKPIELAQARADFDRRVAATPGRSVLIFVHGYNTRFEEAVYRFAQVTHDSGADFVPVLFTWPSRGRALAYFYDRESANYSRDGLEAVLQAVVKDPSVGEVSVLAHSLGNFVAVEAIRQMVIRNHGLSPKIKNIMLAAPDIDVDVFRRQIAEIEAGGKHAPITLFVSQDDRAIDISKIVAGDEPRLGAIDPLAEPYRGMLERENVQVVDLTKLASDDAANHSKFASGDVVHAIGMRLASGQRLNDAKSSLGETLGAMAVNATSAVGNTAATMVSAPFVGIQPEVEAPAVGDAKPLVQ
jgi:esterase/lipase superfamily enzyme